MVEFRTFRLCGCRHGTQCIPQENMKSAAGFLSVWFLCLQGFFVPSLARKPTAVHIFLLNTLCTLRLFSVYVCETLFYCAFFVRNSFFALSLRENCLVARCVRKLTYKVLVIQCIIIRRCIFGRFICICRLVCGVTKERICC